jgi:aryl sulfotransferase
MTTPVAWPRKARELHDDLLDSTVWNDFAFRDDDIVIAASAPDGTAWAQQIVGQLLFGGAADVPAHALSPCLDRRVAPAPETLALLASQTHRRFMTTHLPVDALVYSPRAKYLYVGPDWLARDASPLRPSWEHVRSWWAIRDLPNLLLVHSADLEADLDHEIRRIAQFLAITIYPDRWPAIREHCTFEWMLTHAIVDANARWREALTADGVPRYEAKAEHELGTACARWLQDGTRAARA